MGEMVLNSGPHRGETFRSVYESDGKYANTIAGKKNSLINEELKQFAVYVHSRRKVDKDVEQKVRERVKAEFDLMYTLTDENPLRKEDFRRISSVKQQDAPGVETMRRWTWRQSGYDKRFLIDTGATVSLVKRSACIEKGIEFVPSDRVMRDVSGTEIRTLGSAQVQIEIPVEKAETGNRRRLGVCTRVSDVIGVPDELTEKNILSLKDLEQVQIEVGRLTTFRFPGGWEHVVRSDLREITLEVGVKRIDSNEETCISGQEQGCLQDVDGF